MRRWFVFECFVTTWITADASVDALWFNLISYLLWRHIFQTGVGFGANLTQTEMVYTASEKLSDSFLLHVSTSFSWIFLYFLVLCWLWLAPSTSDSLDGPEGLH